EDLCRMARDHGSRVRPWDQGRQSEKRRFSAESGGVHRGGASGHGRYGQKHPGRGAAVANEPGSFRLSGQLETLGILFMHHIIPTSLSVPISIAATTNQRKDERKRG